MGGLRKGNRWEREGESAQSRASKGLQQPAWPRSLLQLQLPAASRLRHPGPSPWARPSAHARTPLWRPRKALLSQPLSKLASPVSSRSWLMLTSEIGARSKIWSPGVPESEVLLPRRQSTTADEGGLLSLRMRLGRPSLSYELCGR